MDSFIVLNLLYTLCSVSAAEAGTNLLDLTLPGVEFKENFYEINEHNSFENVNIMQHSEHRNKEQFTRHTKYYNQSIIFNLLCYGRNMTDQHRLTWRHFIGDTEVGRVSLNSLKPNNNYTLSLLARSYDNHSVIYCTATDTLTGEIINRTDEIKFQMNDFLNENFASIATCQGNYSAGSTEPCAIGNRHNRVLELQQRRNKEYPSVYEVIPSAYYNENYPIITHQCSGADRSITITPEGGARVNTNSTFRLERSDNGTVIYCSRYRSVSHKFGLQDKDNEHTVKRETYNERIYIYNDLYMKDAYHQYSPKPVNLIIISFTISGIILVAAICLNIGLCVYPRIRKRRQRQQASNNI